MQRRGLRVGTLLMAAVALILGLAAPQASAGAGRVAPVELTRKLLQDVSIIGPKNAWAVGVTIDGAYYRTITEHWNGAEWRVVDSPNPGGYRDSELSSVDAVGPGNVWAVGTFDTAAGSRPHVEHWDGRTWSRGLVHGVSAKYSLLEDVAVVSDRDIWAVGRSIGRGGSSQPLAIHWDGHSWQSVPMAPAPDAWLFGVSATGSNDVWAVGSNSRDGGVVNLIEHWDGDNWSVVNMPDPECFDYGSRLEDIAALSENDAWAVGNASCSSGPGSSELVHWDGRSWTLVPGAHAPGRRPPELDAMAATGPNDVWAAGATSYAQRATFIERWNGASWVRVSSPNPGGTYSDLVRGIDALNPHNAWAIGFSQHHFGLQYFMHWDGTAWTSWP